MSGLGLQSFAGDAGAAIVGGAERGLQVSDIRAVVIYEPSRGRIFHVHHEVTFAGVDAISDDEMIRRAMSHARASLSLMKVAVPKHLEGLKVDPAALGSENALRVDPKRRVLVIARLQSTKTSRPRKRQRQKL